MLIIIVIMCNSKFSIDSFPISSDWISLIKILGLLHNFVRTIVKVGVSTKYIDDQIFKKAKEFNVISSATGKYSGYSGFSCLSVNNVVCHGLPSNDVILCNLDILKVDICITNSSGWNADVARSIIVDSGGPYSSEEISRKNRLELLVDGTLNCLNSLEDYLNMITHSFMYNNLTIGRFILDWAKIKKYSVVFDYSGHRIGKELHMKPTIPNFVYDDEDINSRNFYMFKNGDMLCIEPMFTDFVYENNKLDVFNNFNDTVDPWSVFTKNGDDSTHVEDMFLYSNNKFYNITSWF